MPLHLDGTMAEALAAADRSDGIYEDQILQVIADDPYPPGVAFGLFVNLVHLLAELGWTPAELAQQAAQHAEIHLTDGEA